MTRWLFLWLLLVGKINCQENDEETTEAARSTNEAEGEEQEQDQGQEKEKEQVQEQEQEKDQDADQEKNEDKDHDQEKEQDQDQDQDQENEKEKEKEKEKDQDQDQEKDQDQDQEKGQEQDQEQENEKEQEQEPARELEEEQEEDKEKNQEKRQKPAMELDKEDGPDPLVEQSHSEVDDALGGRGTVRQAKIYNTAPTEDDVQTSPSPDTDNKDTESPDISPFTEVSDNNLPDVEYRRTDDDFTSTQMTSLPFIALRQEPECLNEGGICGLYETCPVCMRGRPKLCPKAEEKRGEYRYQEVYDPRRDAAVCCFGFPVKETRCWKKSGVCIHIHEYCPSNRLFINATDCGQDKKCCMKKNSQHVHVIEY